MAQKTDSHNTRIRELAFFTYLYSWAERRNVDLDRLLLSGEGLTLPQVRSFAAWLRAPRAQPNGVIPQGKRRTINAAFGACSVICTWFIRQFANPAANRARRAIDVEMLVQAQKQAWKDVRIKVRQDPVAPDMTEDEVAAVERFLKPESRSTAVGQAIAMRDYLMWRMAIELGMRKGEILAMRTMDCPTRAAPYFKIVRIEERGPDSTDPRKNPPRPKTLSRDLGLIVENTVFPKLVADYISAYRFRMVERNGKKTKKFLLSHNFLIVAGSGEPLSIRAADDVAKAISAGAGVDFNWHLARHAFFNRAYAGVTDIEDRDEYSAKMADLVYWGGWESEKSLEIYTRRARADRARHALRTWQKGDDRWIALA
ncbi:site-specific integrase [Aquisalimonas asiatica]|uniref:site-specific integrase n=1 Tax=Aquisalimonas asiatica TaxID=406100 RepID=UPI00149590F0|nr:site-specific integrase [Aquisalimonas asiatica]